MHERPTHSVRFTAPTLLMTAEVCECLASAASRGEQSKALLEGSGYGG